MALFRFLVFVLMTGAVFEIMVHEVWVPFHGVDDRRPLCLPISWGVEDGLHERLDIDKDAMVPEVVGRASIDREAGGKLL